MVWVCLFNRLSALKSLLHNLLQAEDIVKVNEARLTEKETSSLDLKEVANYRSTLKVCHPSVKGPGRRRAFLLASGRHHILCVSANEK